MKWIFKLTAVGAALWSGYWYVGAQAQEKMYASLLADGRDQGWTVESRNLGVEGFPNRFDTTITDINLSDPSGKWSWTGETFQLNALSYQPNHIIMAWDGEQIVKTPEGDATINAELLRASLVVSPSRSLPLSRFQIEGTNVVVESSRQWAANIGLLNAALHQNEDVDTRYRLGVELSDIVPPSTLVGRLGGGAFTSNLVEKVYLSANIDFDREIDRHAFESNTPPRPISAEITSSVIIWGDSELTVSGALLMAGNGYVEGNLDFDVQNWQPLFEMFKQASQLTTTEKLTLKRALDGASSGGNLVFTVNFENGETSIGPFTIGPAPVYPF